MYSGKSPEEVVSLCAANGLVPMLLGEGECRIGSGALFVYHEKTLQELIDDNLPLLQKYGWPETTEGFAKSVSSAESVSATSQSDLFTLIAYAFRDSRTEFQRPDPNSWTVPLSAEGSYARASRRLRKAASQLIHRS